MDNSKDFHDETTMEGWAGFFAKAALLGHDRTQLETGKEICLYDHFDSIEAGRDMLSVASKQQRRKRQLTFFNESIASRQRLGQGKHDRGESVLFADGIFEARDDLQGLGFHMPGHIKTLSVLHKRIKAGEVWDISVRGNAWGLDDLEELYNVVNVGELIIEPGGRLIVQGNVFALVCQKLICLPFKDPADAKGGASPYQIGILPTPFSVDMKSGDFNGGNGKPGRDGVKGQDGREAQVTSSLLGPRLAQPISVSDMQGVSGTNGADGGPGRDGRNGGMCKIAELTIIELVGELKVFVHAGEGGFGGNGGNGGNGGQGGNGANGQILLDGYLEAGQGGAGGAGGNGGKGGNGGNGGLASNVYISVAPDSEKQVHCLSLPSLGGFGGMGGSPGCDGMPGKPGIVARQALTEFTNSNKQSLTQNIIKNKCKSADQGFHFGISVREEAGFSKHKEEAALSRKGREGKRGLRGRGRPAAWVFVNELRREL